MGKAQLYNKADMLLAHYLLKHGELAPAVMASIMLHHLSEQKAADNIHFGICRHLRFRLKQVPGMRRMARKATNSNVTAFWLGRLGFDAAPLSVTGI